MGSNIHGCPDLSDICQKGAEPSQRVGQWVGQWVGWFAK